MFENTDFNICTILPSLKTLEYSCLFMNALNFLRKIKFSLLFVSIIYEYFYLAIFCWSFLKLVLFWIELKTICNHLVFVVDRSIINFFKNQFLQILYCCCHLTHFRLLIIFMALRIYFSLWVWLPYSIVYLVIFQIQACSRLSCSTTFYCSCLLWYSFLLKISLFESTTLC